MNFIRGSKGGLFFIFKLVHGKRVIFLYWCKMDGSFGELEMIPFAKFVKERSSVWYSDYNKVKHNREKNLIKQILKIV